MDNIDEVFQCSITSWNTLLPQNPSDGVVYYYLQAIAPNQPTSSWILPLENLMWGGRRQAREKETASINLSILWYSI